MNAHERYVRALREAADAYEEANCGRVRPRRHRGPVRVEHEPIDEQTKAVARAQLRRAGLVSVR